MVSGDTFPVKKKLNIQLSGIMRICTSIFLTLVVSSSAALSEYPKAEEEAVHLVSDFANLAQGVAEATRTPLNEFWEEEVSHSASALRDKIAKIKWQDIPDQAEQFIYQTATEARDAVYAIKWEDLPEKAKQYVKDHPYQTTFLVIEGLVFIYPGPMNAIVLRMLGFTPLGPQAGKNIFSYKFSSSSGKKN
jgi:hypothetical protein